MRKTVAKNKMHYLIPVIGIIAMLVISQILKAKPLSRYEVGRLLNLKAIEWGLEVALVYAIVEVESNFNSRAKNPADPSYGLMQITPILAQDYGYVSSWRFTTKEEIKAIYDPQINLDIGCRFLAKLISKYSFDEAVQMYNVGEYGYERGVRNFDYLNKVKRAYEKY